MKFEIRIVTQSKMCRLRFRDYTFYYLPLGLRKFRGTINPAIRLRVTRRTPRLRSDADVVPRAANRMTYIVGGNVPDKVEPPRLVKQLCAAHANINPTPGMLIPMCDDSACMFGRAHQSWDAL